MSLTATTRPKAGTRWSYPSRHSEDVPFHLQPTYITLHRMLIRYQLNILLQPPSDVLSAFQEQVQKELRSPLPYQRTKWLHNIEYARTLLLQLEHAAQGIKVQRSKRDAIRDLAEKRTVIKRLRSRVEEIGREVEALGEAAWEDDGESETLEGILGRPLLPEDENASQRERGDTLEDGKPVTNMGVEDKAETTGESSKNTSTRSEKDELFGARRRRGDNTNDKSNATTSGFSNLEGTEKVLLNDSRTQEDLTTSLVSMAAQLKQQARAFQGALDLDKGLLDRALEGLEKNVSGMAATSKNMQFLSRMSEGEGWWGRMKLYAIIFGLWIAAILLVGIVPKLRF